MIKLRLSIDRETLFLLAELFDDLVQNWSGQANRMPNDFLGQDIEMMEEWNSSLKEQFGKDAAMMRQKLFEGVEVPPTIILNPDEVDPFLRTCSALRLEIHHQYLKDLPDPMLESGEINPDALDPEAQRFLGIFFFLGGIQQLVLEKLL